MIVVNFLIKNAGNTPRSYYDGDFVIEDKSGRIYNPVQSDLIHFELNPLIEIFKRLYFGMPANSDISQLNFGYWATNKLQYRIAFDSMTPISNNGIYLYCHDNLLYTLNTIYLNPVLREEPGLKNMGFVISEDRDDRYLSWKKEKFNSSEEITYLFANLAHVASYEQSFEYTANNRRKIEDKCVATAKVLTAFIQKKGFVQKNSDKEKAIYKQIFEKVEEGWKVNCMIAAFYNDIGGSEKLKMAITFSINIKEHHRLRTNYGR